MIERIQLAHLPTPIEHLSNLTRILKGPDLYVKRDDLTGLGLGGNKTRKLEYLTGDALAQDSETLISAGAINRTTAVRWLQQPPSWDWHVSSC